MLGVGAADGLVHRPQPPTQDEHRHIVFAQQDVDGADAVGEHGDPGGVQVPGDELGGGAGINDHHRAVLDEFGGPATDRVLLLGELRSGFVDGVRAWTVHPAALIMFAHIDDATCAIRASQCLMRETRTNVKLVEHTVEEDRTYKRVSLTTRQTK